MPCVCVLCILIQYTTTASYHTISPGMNSAHWPINFRSLSDNVIIFISIRLFFNIFSSSWFLFVFSFFPHSDFHCKCVSKKKKKKKREIGRESSFFVVKVFRKYNTLCYRIVAFNFRHIHFVIVVFVPFSFFIFQSQNDKKFPFLYIYWVLQVHIILKYSIAINHHILLCCFSLIEREFRFNRFVALSYETVTRKKKREKPKRMIGKVLQNVPKQLITCYFII